MGAVMQSQNARSMLGDFLMEMVSTFAFAIVAGLTYGQSILYPAIAIGLGCAVLVSSERTHMNPVISFALALVDEDVGWAELLLRILAQLIGCLIGGIIGVDKLRNDVLNFSEKTGKSSAKLFVYEMVFSCVLVLVVLRTRERPTGAYAHGLCYTIAILCGFLLFEGAALINPIIAAGLLVGSSSFDDKETDEGDIWVYLVAPFIGCLLAVLFYLLTECLKEDDDEEESEYNLKGNEYKNVKPMKNPLHDDDETTEYVSANQNVQKPKPAVNGANYQAPVIQKYPQSGNGNSQRNGYSQPSTSKGSHYQQAGVNYQQGNLNPALRKRNIASNGQTPNASPYETGSYSQAPGYRPPRNTQPQNIGNRAQNV